MMLSNAGSRMPFPNTDRSQLTGQSTVMTVPVDGVDTSLTYEMKQATLVDVSFSF